MHWSHILTSRLTADVKLVGATISCEPCWQGGDVANAKRHNAHVQSYFMATDQVCYISTLWQNMLAANVSNCYNMPSATTRMCSVTSRPPTRCACVWDDSQARKQPDAAKSHNVHV